LLSDDQNRIQVELFIKELGLLINKSKKKKNIERRKSGQVFASELFQVKI
jgi:hypothetical protein